MAQLFIIDFIIEGLKWWTNRSPFGLVKKVISDFRRFWRDKIHFFVEKKVNEVDKMNYLMLLASFMANVVTCKQGNSFSREYESHHFNRETSFLELYGDCVVDDVKNRVLKGHILSSVEMTVEMCISTCREKGFDYAGLQWSIECYCGNEPDQGFEWAWLDKCDNNCAGDSRQVCGGSSAMSVYSIEGFREMDKSKNDHASLIQYRLFSIFHKKFIHIEHRTLSK